MSATFSSTARTAGDLPPLVAAVRSLYETHPYPRYPLLAKPRWVDGYLTTSLFSHALAADGAGRIGGAPAREGTGVPPGRRSVLIAGSGEILPYVVRQWEPWSHGVTCVDLSRSSLRRARIRLALNPKPVRWVAADLDHYLATALCGEKSGLFGHIDAFGVLHHMPNPGRTLDLMAKALVPGGTARLMVYNSGARRWIRSLQRLFAILKVDPRVPRDLRFARDALTQVAQWSPALADRLGQMGRETLANPARFADTFLHPRECSLDIAWWWQRLAQAGLRIVGIFDRYGELDDLPNPLWQPPPPRDLEIRAKDGRFEGNLEIYLQKPGDVIPRGAIPFARGMRGLESINLWRQGPPRGWFVFRETKDLTLVQRWALWRAYLAQLRGPGHGATGRLPSGLSLRTMQRLARIGAILPRQMASQDERRAVMEPMVDQGDRLEGTLPVSAPFPIPGDLLEVFAQRLRDEGCYSDRRMQALAERLRRVASGGSSS